MSTTGAGYSGSQRCVILVRGALGPRAEQAFDGFTAYRDGSNTRLEGAVLDQAALRGAIARVGALGLDLLEVRVLGPVDPA